MIEYQRIGHMLKGNVSRRVLAEHAWDSGHAMGTSVIAHNYRYGLCMQDTSYCVGVCKDSFKR